MKIDLKKLAGWGFARLKEKSTWTGLAMIAVTLGSPTLGAAIGQAGQIATLIFGTGLAAATTRPDEA